MKIEKFLSKPLLSIYLNITFVFELIGSIGMLITGVFMVLNNTLYGFFDMSGNHWLATKQIIFVIILLLLVFRIVPNWTKLNNLINKEEEFGPDNLSFKKLTKSSVIINSLVLVNLILAATHTFYN